MSLCSSNCSIETASQFSPLLPNYACLNRDFLEQQRSLGHGHPFSGCQVANARCGGGCNLPERREHRTVSVYGPRGGGHVQLGCFCVPLAGLATLVDDDIVECSH